MKFNKLQISVLSVLLTGLLQCSYGWAAGAAGGSAGAGAAGTGTGAAPGAANPASPTGGATNGAVGNGATPGAAGGSNPGLVTPARPAVNPNQPASPTGQDLNPTANPVKKDMNRVDPNTRDTRAGNGTNNTNTRTMPPASDNGCNTVGGQPTTGGSDCIPMNTTPR